MSKISLEKYAGQVKVLREQPQQVVLLLLSFVAVCALVMGTTTTAFAAATNINAPGDWPAGGVITLNDGDVLNIGAEAGSPAVSTVINIAADANVTIKGNGSMIDNLRINENSADTASHTVTVDNLELTAAASIYSTYNQYRGTIVLVGANEFDGANNDSAIYSLLHNSTIASSSGGSLVLRGGASRAAIADTSALLNVQGSAEVTAYGGSGAPGLQLASLTIDSDAAVTTIGGGTGQGIAYSSALSIANYGAFTAAGFPAISSGSGLTFTMGPGATTTLTNNSPSTETHLFTMDASAPAGSQWNLSDSAFFSTGHTATENPGTVVFPGGQTGTVRLVVLGPPAISVCEIGSTYYATLGEALAQVPSGGATPTTIKLLADITDTDCDVITDCNIIFDLNGHNLIFKGVTRDALDMDNSTIDYINRGAGSLQVIGSSGVYNGLCIGGGSCKLTHAETDGFSAIDAYDGATVIVNGSVTATGNGIKAVYADPGSTVTINGGIEVTGDDSYGVDAEDAGTIVSVNGNIVVKGDENWGVNAIGGATVEVTGYVTATGSQSGGVLAQEGSLIKVSGDVTGGTDCSAVFADDSDISVGGLVTAFGDADGVEAYFGANVEVGSILAKDGAGGVFAISGVLGNPITVTVDGDVIADDYCIAAHNDVEVNVGGDVSGTGVIASGGSKTVIDGMLTATGDYINFNGTIKNAGDNDASSSKSGYLQYSDGTSYVWIKDTTPPVPTTYALSVNSGSGSGNYEAGKVVAIVADAAPTGKVFDQWTGGGAGSFADASSPSTSFTMPAAAATVVATYKDAPPAVTVTSVTVSPSPIEVQKGTTQQFAATVVGTGSPAQTVDWSVEGNDDAATTISSTGLLTVAASETASTLTVKATSTVDHGKSGTATVTVTDAPPAPTHSIALDVSGTYVFAPATVGYGAQTAHSVKVTNTGNQPTGTLSVALSGADADAFELSGTGLSSIAVGGSANFSVQPITGLAAGTYSATVTVTGDNQISKSFEVSFTVNPEPAVTYDLTVVSGTGSGTYEASVEVAISASAAPTGKVFDQWISTGGGSFADASSASTTFTMPAGDATVTATYKDAPGDGGSGGTGGGTGGGGQQGGGSGQQGGSGSGAIVLPASKGKGSLPQSGDSNKLGLVLACGSLALLMVGGLALYQWKKQYRNAPIK